MMTEVPAGLRSLLETPFGVPGFSDFQLRVTGFNESEGELLLRIITSVRHVHPEELWELQIIFPEEDAASASPSSPQSSYEWFSLMVRENIIEWWSTRKKEPNILLARRVG
jgi:hypothetical protein